MKVLISDEIDVQALDLLEGRGLEVQVEAALGDAALHAAVADADGWIVRSRTRITAALLESAPRLKVVGRAGVGVDNIDVAAATRRGIAVLNTPAGNTIAAVEHTLAMLLALARHVPMAHASLVGEGRWDRAAFTGIELHGKTLGLVGLGKIGSRVATRCRAFEMAVVGYDPYLPAERAESLGVELLPDLDALLGRSDFISLHAPASADGRAMLDAARLERTKPGVRIINCARGSLIDEGALAEALVSGRVAGAALDVFEHEPPVDSPLLRAPNLVATPHLGASTVESQRNVGLLIAEQVADALQHEVFRAAVNIPVEDWTTLAALAPQLAMVERLGQVAQQYVDDAISRVQVEYLGGPFEELAALDNALLKGLLSPVVGEGVNAVNATLLAEERGIELSHRERLESADYHSLVRLQVHAGGAVHTLSATSFADREPRLVEVDGYDVELFLEGNLLLFINRDRPGVIGDVGAVLGRHQINIAHFSLGRQSAGGEALGVVVVDEPLRPEVIDEITELNNMKWVRQIQISAIGAQISDI